MRRFLSALLISGVMAFTAGTSFAADTTVLLGKDAAWKFLDNGVDLGTAWSAPNFDDSAWKLGKAPLGFGDDFSETDPTLPIATVVDYGNPDDKNITTYFRTTIDAANLKNFKELSVYVHVDDGAVVYVNGTEAFRKGIKDGPVNYKTGAKFKPKEETFTMPVSMLSEGKNVIAAEVHQDDGSSSDLWFEMSIKGVPIATVAKAPEAVAAPIVPTAPATAADVKISKIVATFNGNTTSSIGLAWYTNQNSFNSHVQVIEKGAGAPDFSKAVMYTGRLFQSTNSKSEFVHKAEATGLKADTTYSYRVGDAYLGKWSEIGSFRTAPAAGAFTFIDMADTQAKTEDEAILSAATIAKAQASVPNSRFLAINGDIVDVGMVEKQWDWVFGHAQNSLLNTTFVACAGNHDEDKNSFYEHLNMVPAKGSDTSTGVYTSFDYSNAHFIILNNNEDSKEYADFTPAQIEWLKADAKAAKAAGAEWLIVFMHKGPYTTSNHATDADIMGANGVRTLVAPMMEDLGVDLVFQGHDHIYARTKPVSHGSVAKYGKMVGTLNGLPVDYAVNPEGTVYFIPSTAGPKVYYKNKKIASSYYDLFAVADESHAAIYGPDPSDKSRPVRSTIQNFSSITVDGDELTVVSFEIDQNKDGGKPYIIDQFGIVK